MGVIAAPSEWIEDVSRLKLPSQSDERLRQLMDKNNEGKLTAAEREELESLVEWSESISIIRARAFQLLGLKPT